MLNTWIARSVTPTCHARAVARQLGVEEVRGEVKPQDKACLVAKLQRGGRVVAIAGDGIAMGNPLAAGLPYPLTGHLLSPMIAALAMSLSSVSVAGNDLRLRQVSFDGAARGLDLATVARSKMASARADPVVSRTEKLSCQGVRTMKSINLRVEGMSCTSCVRHVNAALAPVAGVAEVAVDLATGSVRVSGEADAQALLAALQDAGYPAKVEDSAPALQGAKARGGCGSSCGCH